MDGDEELSNSWRDNVKYYAQFVIERFEFGVDQVKELLSTLMSDEWWGVMLEFEEVCSKKFGQLVSDAPHWTEWIA